MNLKKTKKLSDLKFPAKHLIKDSDGTQIKGGGWVYCCGRNKWVRK